MITNVVVLDHWGVVKCDVGIKAGRIAALGKAGNPDVMDGVDPDLEIGPTTEIIAGEGRILTAGGIDWPRALHLPADRRRGGRGRDDDADRRRHRAGRGHARDDLHAVAVGDPRDAAGDGRDARSTCCCSARATRCRCDGLREQARAGVGRLQAARGLGLDARRRSTPACGRRRDRRAGRDPHRHAQRGRLRAVDARRDRRPDDPRLPHRGRGRRPRAGHHQRSPSQPNVLPSSTNPTRPHTVNTVDEHLDMLIVCHHLNPRIPEDLAFAESRIRGTTIAAEDVLHDLGAISMIGSDSQAMGRVGETIVRTWQTAHVMAARRGGDRQRAAASATSPSTRSARRSRTGSTARWARVEVGKLADLVLWDPAYFAIRPRLVIKGGAIAYAPMGDANASIPTPQPVLMRPMFAGSGRLAARRSLAFVSPLARRARSATSGSRRGVVGGRASTRALTKADMPLNDACPEIRVDPDTFKVWIDGDEVVPDPRRRAAARAALLAVLMDPLDAAAGRLALPVRLLRALARARAGGRRRAARRARVHPRPPAAGRRGRRALRRRGARRRLRARLASSTPSGARADAEPGAARGRPAARRRSCCARPRRSGRRRDRAYRVASHGTPRPIALGVVGAAPPASATRTRRCSRSTTTRRPSRPRR